MRMLRGLFVRNYLQVYLPIRIQNAYKENDNIQLLDETEQNIVIYQWRADQFADAEGRGK